MRYPDVKKIDPNDDLIKFIGDVLRLELDGKREDLPLAIEFFRVTATKENKRGKFLYGYDEERLNREIPIDRIESYIKLDRMKINSSR